MKTRDDLQEQYEEALFALLMDAVVEEEGKSALAENDRLNRTGEVLIHKETTKRNLALINKHFAKTEARIIGISVGRILKKAVLVAAVCAVLLTTAMACVPSVRQMVYTFVLEVFDDSTDITVGEALGYQEPTVPEITVNYLPEGYELLNSGESTTWTWRSYQNKDDNEITVDVYNIESGVLSLDTEDAEVKNTKINGYDTMLIMKETHNQVAIMNNYVNAVCVIYSTTASVDSLLQIAEGIEF